jgi:co-chaperonin GroES (HSP10)
MRVPNHNLVLIKVDSVEEKTADGIYIQEEWKELPPTGVVLEVGDAVTFVQPGDRVFFERFSAIPTPFGNDVKAITDLGILVKYDEKG